MLGYLRRGGVGVELGVWRGDFSERLLRATRPTALHLVDPWRFVEAPDYADAWYGGAQARDQAAMDEICAGVRRRFARQARVHILRETSQVAARSFQPGSLDWVYVDGDHTHDAVLTDLRAYLPLLRGGGVLAGDDYGVQGWWRDGVTTAVQAFVREYDKVQIVDVHANQFVLRKPGG